MRKHLGAAGVVILVVILLAGLTLALPVGGGTPLMQLALASGMYVMPTPGWPQTTGNQVLSSPALGDLDGDGHLEVVVGS